MKLPFSFSFKFVFRLLLPGFLAALSLVPVLNVILLRLDVTFPLEWAFLLLCVLLGWLFVLLDMQVYMVLEGRRYWPRSLKRISLAREKRRLTRLESLARKTQLLDRDRYLEASVELRQFPMNEQGVYVASAPTRIGNLILSYEEYPARVYGMDSVFYWTRIWLLMDDSQRKEIDDQQAIADSAAYSTVALWFDGVICLLFALYTRIGGKLADLLPSASTLTVLAAACFVASYLLYRISLQTQAAFGEIFRAVFDGYRGRVDVAAILDEIKQKWPEAVPSEGRPSDHYRIVWRYLHNFRVRLGNELIPAMSQGRRGQAVHEERSASVTQGRTEGHDQSELPGQQ